MFYRRSTSSRAVRSPTPPHPHLRTYGRRGRHARDRNTPLTYGRRGVRVIVTHPGPTAGGRRGGGWGGRRARSQHSSDLWPTRGGGVRAIITHPGPMADGWGGTRAIVTHHGPMTGGRTYDRRGCLKKEDNYGQGFEKPDSPA